MRSWRIPTLNLIPAGTIMLTIMGTRTIISMVRDCIITTKAPAWDECNSLSR